MRWVPWRSSSAGWASWSHSFSVTQQRLKGINETTRAHGGARRLHRSLPEGNMTARKVLIVEDNAALLRGLKDNFQARGYQVRTASDGAKGMEDFFRDPPDLVLLDLMLPKVNGYEICRQARSRQLATPILMLSAKCQEDDVVHGFELGADDYV